MKASTLSAIVAIFSFLYVFGVHGSFFKVKRSFPCYSARMELAGIKGRVAICSRGAVRNNVHIFLDTRKADTQIFPGCDLNNLKYHIHEFWKGTGSQGVGLSDCGPAVTGGHYDPTLACGPASGSSACPAVRKYTPNFAYSCNSETIRASPFVCELGDLSGKFGLFTADRQRRWTRYRDNIGIPIRQLKGKSIVFHCGNTGAYAFCAKFRKRIRRTRTKSGKRHLVRVSKSGKKRGVSNNIK